MEDVRLRLPVFLPLQSSSSLSSTSSDEPLSPDSGFSSDECSPILQSPLQRQRSGRLRSALRRMPSDGRKRVRFADAIIHQLAIESDEIDEIQARKPSPRRQKLSVSFPNFMFCSESEHFQKARKSGVTVTGLRSCGHSVVVQVAVQNFAFDKEVTLRWSCNEWKDSSDQQAVYSHPGAEDIDVFTATIDLPSQAGQFELCVRYKAGGRECWDNNSSANYRIVWSHK